MQVVEEASVFFVLFFFKRVKCFHLGMCGQILLDICLYLLGEMNGFLCSVVANNHLHRLLVMAKIEH